MVDYERAMQMLEIERELRLELDSLESKLKNCPELYREALEADIERTKREALIFLGLKL